ncbi:MULTISPECIES: SusD/RagB family nutrient-binding outer membrane lipoprotein [Parabacteroides]|nr:SusD/RagB family nutrient-binding outer membrane lipoprotein [Parabacteroides provencensis]
MFKQKITLIIGLAAGILTSCTGNFDDMNVDPQKPTAVSPSLLLPKMQEYGFNCRSWEYQVGENLHTNQYAQYIACSSTGFPTDRYDWKDSWVKDAYWKAYYLYFANNLYSTKNSLEQHPEYSNMYQVMRILGTMVASRTTDVFGDIPYFEAGQGTLSPKYDSQKDIYYDLFKELDEAIASLKANKNDELQSKYGTSDIIYGGDLDKWIKLGNSVRLRLAMRLSYIDPEKAKAEGEKALKDVLMEGNDDTAGIKQDTRSNGHSLWCISFWNEFRVSKTIIDVMLNESSIEDPRLPLHFSQTEGYVNGTSDVRWRGLPNGLPASMMNNKDKYPDYLPENTSCIWGYNSCGNWNSNPKGSKVTAPSSYYAQVTKPFIVFNYAEVCFLKAEAAIRGWAGAGDAKANYEAGIRASFAEARENADPTVYTTDNDDAYINGGNVKWDEGADFEGKLKRIITQKWIGIYPNGVEAWSEFRRTGYPDFTPVVESDLDLLPKGTFIKKLRYIDDEQSLNPNSKDPSLNQGKGDGQNVRVWWDTGRYK